MYISPAHRLKLYRNFKAIDTKDPYGIIRYYEQYEEELYSLETEEYLDCTIIYCDALFETDDYARHVVMCDHLIELVMAEGVYLWGGEDVFCRLLLNKGTSLYLAGHLPDAIYVLSSLVRINPTNQNAVMLLTHCLQKERTPQRMRNRAVALLILMISALLAGVTGFVVQPFYPEYLHAITQITIGLFITGTGLLGLTEIFHIALCRRTVRHMVKKDEGTY